MILPKLDFTNNRHFKHFRVCGPIEINKIKYIYAIPKTFCAGKILIDKGYKQIYSIMLGKIYRKILQQHGKEK